MNLYRKPWSIYVLSIAQLLTPISDICLGAIRYKVSPWTFLITVFRDHQWHQLVEIFAVAPLGGLAILCVRWWSYPIFLASLFWTGLSNFLVWRAHPESVSLSLLLACYALNLVLVSYFLIPSVREMYFNPRVRWWEAKPRYMISMPAVIRVKGKNKNCTLINISEGGASIEVPLKMNPGTSLSIQFSCLTQEVHVSGEVVYQLKDSSTTQKKYVYGVQFVFTRKTKKQVNKCIKAFELFDIERRPKRENNFQSFITWVKDSIRGGSDFLIHRRSTATIE